MECKDAKALKLIRYNTGRSCKRGHYADRFTSSQQCVMCLRDHTEGYRKANPAYRVEKERQWRLNNPASFRASVKKWHARNPAWCAARSAQRRAEKKQRTLRLNDQHKAELFQFYKERPTGCHVDHIVPLKGKLVCGLHVPWNLQYLSARDNQTKYNKEA